MEAYTSEWLAERGWLASVLSHRSFPVGLLFVKIHPQENSTFSGNTTAAASRGGGGSNSTSSSSGSVEDLLQLDDKTRLKIKHFAKRLTTVLMQTKQMRERFHAYRISFGSSPQLLESKPDDVTTVAVKSSKIIINHDLEEVVVEPSDMINKNLDHVICRLAVPLMASLAMEPVFSLIDTFYIGKQLGSTTCLSAFGLSGKKEMVLFMKEIPSLAS